MLNTAYFSINPDLKNGFGHYLHYDLKIKANLPTGIDYFRIFAHKDSKKSLHDDFITPRFKRDTYEDLNPLRLDVLKSYKTGLRKTFEEIKAVKAKKKIIFQYMGSVWHAWILAEVASEFQLPDTVIKINIFHDRAALLSPDFGNSPTFQEYAFILNKLKKSPVELYTDTLEAQAAFSKYFKCSLKYLPMFSVSNFTKTKPQTRKSELLSICYPGNVQKAKGFDLLSKVLNKLDLNQAIWTIRTYISYYRSDSQVWINALPQHSNLNIIEGSLSEEEYNRILVDADIILLPYRAHDFGGRTSGIYADAIDLGKPVVITAETWGGKYTEIFNNGVTFKDGDVDLFYSAVEKAIRNFTKLKKAAQSAKRDWKKVNGINKFINEIVKYPASYVPYETLPSKELLDLIRETRPKGLSFIIQKVKSSTTAGKLKKRLLQIINSLKS